MIQTPRWVEQPGIVADTQSLKTVELERLVLVWVGRNVEPELDPSASQRSCHLQELWEGWDSHAVLLWGGEASVVWNRLRNIH